MCCCTDQTLSPLALICALGKQSFYKVVRRKLPRRHLQIWACSSAMALIIYGFNPWHQSRARKNAGLLSPMSHHLARRYGNISRFRWEKLFLDSKSGNWKLLACAQSALGDSSRRDGAYHRAASGEWRCCWVLAGVNKLTPTVAAQYRRFSRWLAVAPGVFHRDENAPFPLPRYSPFCRAGLDFRVTMNGCSLVSVRQPYRSPGC